MLRAVLWLAVPTLVACNPCPAGTRPYDVPLTGAQTEKYCRSEGGIVHGPYHRYDGGRLVLEGSYEFGDRSGTWTTYGPRGQIVAVQQYQADEKAGTWKQWTDDGVLISEVSYDRDLKHGPERAWYPDGTPKLKGGNVEGRRDGVWTAWYRNGRRQ